MKNAIQNNLDNEFKVVALEERLEMVQMAAFGEDLAISCFADKDSASASLEATSAE